MSRSRLKRFVTMEPAEAMEHLRGIVEKMRLELAEKLV